MDKVKALEGVLLLDAPEQVDAAVAAGVSLDGGALVDDLELVAVGGDGELVLGDDGDDGEEGALGLPALGAAAGVVVEDVAGEGHLDGLALAVAAEPAPLEGGAALGEAVVDGGVDRDGHFVGCEELFADLRCDDSS